MLQELRSVIVGGALIHKNHEGSKHEGRRIRPTIGGFGGNCASNLFPFNNGRIEEWEEKKKKDRVSTPNIFCSKILINNSVCSLIIDGCSIDNLVSRKLVDFLKLPMKICSVEGRRIAMVPPKVTPQLPKPEVKVEEKIVKAEIGWIKKVPALKVVEICKVPLVIGKHYNELVTCDVVDIEACHVLLGIPWQHDMDATHQENKTLATLVASPKEFQAERKETRVSYALVVKGVEDVMENAIPAIFATEYCDDGSRPEEQHLVVLCFDEEIVKFPTQPATTEISREDGSNLEDFLIVLTRDEFDIIKPIMAVEEEPLMMLGSGLNIIKEDFSNDLDGQHSTDKRQGVFEGRSNDTILEILRMELLLKKYGPYKILRKINDNAYVVDLPNTMSILKTFNVSDIYEFHSEDVNDGKHSRTSSSKERGNDEDMIQKLAEEYIVSKNK
ncbi:hypothetical protein Tco_0829372 [Tanacetum coccineum]